MENEVFLGLLHRKTFVGITFNLHRENIFIYSKVLEIYTSSNFHISKGKKKNKETQA